MKTRAKAARRTSRTGRHAAAPVRRAYRPTQANRVHVAAKSSTEIAQEGTDVSRQ